MPLSAVEKVRTLLNVFTDQDDQKLDGYELNALSAVGRTKAGRFSPAAANVLVSYYNDPNSAFESEIVKDGLKGLLLGVGVKPVRLGIKVGNTSPDLATFERLSNDQKMKALFPDYRKGADAIDYSMARGFRTLAVRLTDTLSGAVLGRALKEYKETRNASFGLGGGIPDVRALLRGDVLYGFTISAGADGGEWSGTAVYDREFNHIGGWSYSE